MGRRGTRPRQPADQRYDNAYLFGAICPARGVGAALVLPYADADMMQLPSTKSRATSPRAPTLFCSSTGPDGTPRASSTYPTTSRRSSCLPAPRSSTRSRTSGNTSARTGPQTPSSKTTTRSSTPHAPLGESSSLNPKPSPPSECATGLTSVSRYDHWCNPYESCLADLLAVEGYEG